MKLTDEQFQERVNILLAKESEQPRKWWWCSFADSEKGFLGGCLVEARGILTASHRARILGINPGGQMLAFPIDVGRIPKSALNRLLTEAEVHEIFPETRGKQ